MHGVERNLAEYIDGFYNPVRRHSRNRYHSPVDFERRFLAIIYDIKEAMGDSAEAIAAYSVAIDLSWRAPPYPSAVTKTLLISGDRDLVPAELGELASRYHAVAGDWESGAIAYTCARNRQRLVILRGISDLVTSTGGEVYGNMDGFVEGAGIVMARLMGELPAWLERMP